MESLVVGLFFFSKKRFEICLGIYIQWKQILRDQRFVLITCLFLPFFVDSLAFGDSEVFQDQGIVFIEGSMCSFVLCVEG